MKENGKPRRRIRSELPIGNFRCFASAINAVYRKDWKPPIRECERVTLLKATRGIEKQTSSELLTRGITDASSPIKAACRIERKPSLRDGNKVPLLKERESQKRKLEVNY